LAIGGEDGRVGGERDGAELGPLALEAADELGREMLRVGGRAAIAAGQHLAAAGDASQDGLHRLAAMGLLSTCAGLVLQVGTVDEVLLDPLFEHDSAVSTSVSSLAGALQAARAAAGSQEYPRGALYVVATPIGNLADVTLRALHVLEIADRVACEDTRHTHSLLRAYGIDRAGDRLLAVHQHNEAEAAQKVVAWLQAGERVAYASDAGTPAVSDPGARLVAAVREAGLRVVPLPGASSVTTVLSAAGSVQDGGFVFARLPASKAGERDTAVQQLRRRARAVVLLEAPHRIAALAQALAVLGERPSPSAANSPSSSNKSRRCAATPSRLAGRRPAQRSRGEFALVLHRSPKRPRPTTAMACACCGCCWPNCR
jgi:16S rRNA (cytidine1402-2'-O)-methyltransferase